MKRPVRDPVTGTYTIKGKTFKELFGSREQVWNGTAYKTKYGLSKEGLHMNQWGRIVSLDKHVTATKEMRLAKYGYGSRKGKFGYVKKNKTQKRQEKKGKNKK